MNIYDINIIMLCRSYVPCCAGFVCEAELWSIRVRQKDYITNPKAKDIQRSIGKYSGTMEYIGTWNIDLEI